jgi:DNA-directed RNA polymerase I, II, and III subunit RPABC2
MSKTTQMEQEEVVGKLTDTAGGEYEFDDNQETKETSRAAQDSLVSLYRHHPECVLDYQESVLAKLPLRVAPVTEDGQEDPHHKTQPFLSVFEKTKILGFRTNQLSQGARPFVKVPAHIKSYLEIAKIELEERRLPFIVKRPLPNGTFEYWRLSDLAVF